MLATILQSLRQSLTLVRRKPGFALMTGAILALGIGATTAVFSMIHGVLLTPPPYVEPDRIVLIGSTEAGDRDAVGRRNWAARHWQEWRDTSDAFAAIAGYRWIFNFLVLDDGSESLEGMMITEEYFDVIGIEPQIGRAFVESDSAGAETPSIVLGYDVWQRHFDGDPGIVGQTIRMSRMPPATVIGVMPADIRFLPSPGVAQEPNYDLHARVDYWMPLPPQARENPAWNVVARLAEGVTPADAEAELAVMLARQADIEPPLAEIGARVDVLADVLNEEGRSILIPLIAAAGLVLLIACSNAAVLLLIRGLQRQHEFGLRSAAGAGRARLFTHAIAESLFLALLGGALGLVLAVVIVRVFAVIGGHAVPRLDDVTIGWPVLAFGLGSAVVACVLAGLIPAYRAASLDPVDALRVGGPKSSQSRGQRRLLNGVVVAQTALTLSLLVGAGLLIRTMFALDAVNSGFSTRNVITMSVTTVENDWQEFHERALERVAAIPGVDGAAFAWGVPLTGNNWPGRIEIEGYSVADDPDAAVFLPLRSVTPGYFDLLGQAFADGRDFRPTDMRDAAPVIVVNEAFVDRYLPGQNVLGRQVWTRGRENPPAEIVGVVANSRTSDLTREAEPEVYLSFWQNGAFSKHLVVGTTRAPETMMGVVQQALRAVEPTVAVENLKTLDTIRGESLASRTFAMRLLVGFAVIACILTLGGIYSVLSLSVALRRREIAIRSAVGAERGAILALVLRQGFRLIAAGVAVGVLAAVLLSQVLRALLYGVGPADPAALAGAGAAFTAVALLAIWAPARHATRVDPVEALRGD